MSAYTNQTKIEGYLQRSLTANEQVNLDALIANISGLINSYCDREWYDYSENPSDPDSETRLYDGNGKRELPIDDCKDIEQIEILDSQSGVLLTLLATTDPVPFITYPHNQEIVESVYLRNNIFPHGVARVRVTAIFGSGVVPAEVVMAATILCGKFIANSSADVTGFRSESIEGYSYTLKSGADLDREQKMALQSLEQFRRLEL